MMWGLFEQIKELREELEFIERIASTKGNLTNDQRFRLIQQAALRALDKK